MRGLWIWLAAGWLATAGYASLASATEPDTESVPRAAAQVEAEEDAIDLDELPADGAEADESGLPVDEEEIDLGEAEVSGEAVTVTAAPAPAVAEVITADEIEQAGVESLGSLLAREAGFTVNDTFAGQEVTYQGLPSKFTVVLVDGQRVPGHILERVDFAQLPLSNLERVEIIRGPQAAAYGSESAGVIVNLITRQPAGTGGNLTLGIGELGYNRQKLALFGGGGSDSWYLSGDRRLRESYDLNSLFPDTDGDSYRQYDVFGKYRAALGRDQFRLQFDFYREDARGQSYSPPDQLRSNEYFTRRSQLNAGYEWQLKGNRSVELTHNYGTYYHNLDRYWVDFPDTTLIRTGFREELQDTRAKYTQYGGGYILTLGTERNWDRLASDRISTASGTETAEVLAGFATGEWFLDADWTIAAALRYDEHQYFGGEWTPKFSLARKLDNQQRIEAAVGRGYRPPSLKERYYEFASPFGYSVVGNDQLQAETTWSYNLDYDLTTPRGYLRAGAFRHEVSNLIIFSEIQASPQIFQTQNVTDGTTTGLQLAAERRWAICPVSRKPEIPVWLPHEQRFKEPAKPPLAWIGLGYDGTWLIDAEDSELGTTLPNSPRWDHRVRVFFEDGPLNSEVLVRNTGSRYLDRENASQAPGYTTVDLTVRHRLDFGQLKLAALNVFDEKDGRYGPEPGRELRMEISIDF